MDNYPYMIVMFLFGVYDAAICRLFCLTIDTRKNGRFTNEHGIENLGN